MTKGAQGHDVLFLCRDNAVLSPMAEALLNHWARGRLRASSAGWSPAPGLHALAVQALRRAQLAPAAVRPRSWAELDRPDAPAFAFVIVLGRDIPDGVAPAFRGDPIVARWPVDDPTVAGAAAGVPDRAFERALREIEARVKLFASLRLENLDRFSTERTLAEIGIAAR